MGALNLLGAAVMGLTVMLTWLLVRFWCLDGMGEESGRLAKMRWSWVAAGAVCLVLTFTMPGLYGATALTFNAWGFMLLLLCVVLQNVYAMNGGQRRWMAVASIVLGVCAVETPWVLLFLPVLFLRAVMTEWRLWDHSAKNLPIWFLGLALGAGVTLAFNTWRVTGGLSPTALWGVEREVLAQVALPTITGWFVGPWLINLGGAVVLPLVAWGVARRLMDNVRSVGLMVAGLVVTAGAVALQWGLEALSPWANWLGLGAQPLAVGWTGALACGMLVAGWGVQLFAKALAYLDPDTHLEPGAVKAGRAVSGVVFAAAIAALGAAAWVQTARFLAMDRGMATRFAAETVEALRQENRTYLLGSRLGTIDPHLALVARERGFPLTIFVPRLADRLGTDEAAPDSEADKALDAALRRNTYAARLRRRLEEDPALGVGDRQRLTHLLDYNFYVFVEDFFKAQPNVREIAAAYDRADVWFALDAHRVTEDVGAGAQRALPKGTFYLPTPAQHLASETEVEALLAAQRDLQTRWAPVVEGEPLSWWDLNRSTQGAVRRHLAFMANNLGVWLNDQGALAEAQALEANHQGRTEEAQTLAATAQKRLAQAADCYYYAFKTNPENLSAKLNAFYLCVERGFLPEHREEIRTDFEAFAKSLQETGRRYDFGSVGYIHGYIRNYAFFVQRGWGWAATAAPEAVLSYLGGRRAALGDASLANVQRRHRRRLRTPRPAGELRGALSRRAEVRSRQLRVVARPGPPGPPAGQSARGRPIPGPRRGRRRCLYARLRCPQVGLRRGPLPRRRLPHLQGHRRRHRGPQGCDRPPQGELREAPEGGGRPGQRPLPRRGPARSGPHRPARRRPRRGRAPPGPRPAGPQRGQAPAHAPGLRPSGLSHGHGRPGRRRQGNRRLSQGQPGGP